MWLWETKVLGTKVESSYLVSLYYLHQRSWNILASPLPVFWVVSGSRNEMDARLFLLDLRPIRWLRRLQKVTPEWRSVRGILVAGDPNQMLIYSCCDLNWLLFCDANGCKLKILCGTVVRYDKLLSVSAR